MVVGVEGGGDEVAASQGQTRRAMEGGRRTASMHRHPASGGTYLARAWLHTATPCTRNHLAQAACPIVSARHYNLKQTQLWRSTPGAALGPP